MMPRYDVDTDRTMAASLLTEVCESRHKLAPMCMSLVSLAAV